MIVNDPEHSKILCFIKFILKLYASTIYLSVYFLLAWDFPVVSTENIFHKLQRNFENLMYMYPKVVLLIWF